MKKLNNNYEAPQVEWVELFAENEVMSMSAGGSVQDPEPGTWNP